MELISREAAIEAIESHLRVGDEVYPLTRTDKILNHAFEIAASCVYNLPSAEVTLCHLDSPCEYQNADIAMPAAERVENIPFGKLKAICRYYTLSYDADKGVESACHSTANMKDGESWGKCNEHDCPFWKETENE